MNDRVLEFDNVSFGYDNSRPILDNASFRIYKGAFVLVKGSSGAGKSTLLKLCCRLEETHSGQILFKGVPVTEMDPPRLRRKVCYMQQTPTLAPGSIGKNLLAPFAYRSSRGTEPPTEQVIRKLLDEFQLSEFGPEDFASNLSVGQKQRVCMIRTILLEPEVMLLDEPTSALDAKSAEIVLGLAQEVNMRKKVTILLVAHAPVKVQLVAPQIMEIEDKKVSIR